MHLIDRIVKHYKQGGLPKNSQKLVNLVEAYIVKRGKNNAKPLTYRAIFYLIGIGEKDHSKAIKHFEMAIKQNFSEAMYWRGRMYERGAGELNQAPNYKMAAKLYRQAIACGQHAEATNRLGYMLVAYAAILGERIKNHSEARALFESVKYKNAHATYNLAFMIEHGWGELHGDKFEAEAKLIYEYCQDSQNNLVKQRATERLARLNRNHMFSRGETLSRPSPARITKQVIIGKDVGRVGGKTA